MRVTAVEEKRAEERVERSESNEETDLNVHGRRQSGRDGLSGAHGAVAQAAHQEIVDVDGGHQSDVEAHGTRQEAGWC